MDRVRIQHQFRKALWVCECGQEDVTDLNIGTPSVYEHNCSVCGKWKNSFKEYNGCLTFSPAEYETKDEKAIDEAKTVLVEKWVYDIKNPAPYTPPVKSDYLQMYQSKLEEAQRELDEYAKLATVEELAVVKAELTAKVDSVQTVIEAKPIEAKPAEEVNEVIK